MHSLKIIFAASAFILCMGTPDLSSAKDQDLNSIRITGSKYVFFSVTDLAKTFSHQRPGNEIIVDSSDQGAGVHTILTRSGDALMVLGKLDDEIKMEAAEKGLYLEERIIGWGAVALVAHPGNPVEELSIDQIRKMFSGNFTNWKQVGGLDEPIVLMSRDESISGTEVIFRNLVLQGFPLAQHTVRLFDPDIMRAVWKTKGGIADARFAESVRGRIKGMVKIISIREDDESPAVQPSAETMLNQTYPLSAPITLYYDSRSPKPTLREFVDYCARRGLGTRHSEVK